MAFFCSIYFGRKLNGSKVIKEKIGGYILPLFVVESYAQGVGVRTFSIFNGKVYQNSVTGKFLQIFGVFLSNLPEIKLI